MARPISLADPLRCVHVGDCESDTYELFCAEHEEKTPSVIHSCDDRLAGREFFALAAAPPSSALGGAFRTGIPLESGAATFSNLRLSKVGVGYKLRVSAFGLPTFTTGVINVA